MMQNYKIYKLNIINIFNMLLCDLKGLLDGFFSIIGINNNKPYKPVVTHNISNPWIVSMSPSDPKGLLDEFIFLTILGAFYNGRHIDVC